MNAISFHPVHGTLATVGSDGRFSFWDKDARTKLKTSEQLDQPITACCFNHNGNIFAYASSYDWSKVRGVKLCMKHSHGPQAELHSCFCDMLSSGPWVLQPPEKELHLPEECCRGAETSEQEMVREGQPLSVNLDTLVTGWGLPYFLNALVTHTGASKSLRELCCAWCGNSSKIGLRLEYCCLELQVAIL